VGSSNKEERRRRARIEAMLRKTLTPELEEQVAVESLRDRAGIDPDTLGPVTDLVALGLANSWWRNSCVEDWHAAGRLDNGDMLRINSYTTQRIRQRLHGWLREMRLNPLETVGVLDDFGPEDFDPLLERIYRWCVAPGRRLPTGPTLVELAGSDLPAYADHADRAVGGFAEMIEDRGARFAFLRAAAHGALACRRWWGHPKWPTLVDEFTDTLDDMRPEQRCVLPPEPAGVADRSRLREALLEHPWQLDEESARWLTATGLGHTPTSA
jgi:hypothetical protein